MEVLGICMSPRKGGNSEILLKEALKGSKECGAKTEFLSLRNLDIKSCNACTDVAWVGFAQSRTICKGFIISY